MKSCFCSLSTYLGGLGGVAWRSIGLLALLAAGCSTQGGSAPIAQQGAPLKLDPAFVNPNNPDDHAEPASNYTLFEVDPVRPVATLAKSGLVLVANTNDDFLEVLEPHGQGVRRCGAVQVGMRPVALAVTSEDRHSAEIWVVNHLSDSVSIVELDTDDCTGRVQQTLQVGDEPRDIVVTETGKHKPRVFVTTAHRGQHHPTDGARTGSDLVTPAGSKSQSGLADVFVFDPLAPSTPLGVVNLFTDTPRALAVGNGVVYAAGFHTGNRTSVIPALHAAKRGLESVTPLLATDTTGNFIVQNGEFSLKDGVAGVASVAGGMRAVSGLGRCIPDPRSQAQDTDFQQVCVRTDANNHVLGAHVETPGAVDPTCQCTSGDGTLQPTTGVIVQFFDSPALCGSAFTTFADASKGCWLDADPKGIETPAANAAEFSPPMAWNDDVRLSLPDQDVFTIDVDHLTVSHAYSQVGTILFDIAVQPQSGRLFVTNTDAKNLTRFEGVGAHSSSTVRGHLYETRITTIDPRSNRVSPVHLNTHIDYSQCCDRRDDENEQSLAFLTQGAFSPDGDKYFFTALGSDKVGVLKASVVGSGFDNTHARARGQLRDLTLGADVAHPAGPVGFALDASRHRLYVKTHFTNELVTVDADRLKVLDRETLPNPEPDSITAGRSVLYNARLTSSHGDSACASCHIFGDFDSLSWDLGDPDNATVKNPGPFAVPTDFVVSGFATNPNAPVPTPDFRSNKGPMNTQTLRGLANDGAMHWRGDRVRRVQDRPGVQPNTGTFNEDNSFGEFDVAITGLNGNDQELDPAVFQAFTNFSLQLTLPPNPVRHLDNTLTDTQAAARALFFGCANMTDADFDAGTCTALDGSTVQVKAETTACHCARNPIAGALRHVPDVASFEGLLRGLLSNPAFQSALNAYIQAEQANPPAVLAVLGPLLSALSQSAVELATTPIVPDANGLLSGAAAKAIVDFNGSVLAIVGASAKLGISAGTDLLNLLTQSIPPNVVPPDSDLRQPAGMQATLATTLGVANVDLRELADQAAQGTSAFRDLLQGCSLSETPTCRLRVTDSFSTCNGCHTLDPKGNAEFGAYRAGFFGTNGEWSFENESQVLKIPHLRNIYQKVGMFGSPSAAFFINDSVLGPGRGGPFGDETVYQGPQVRGVGFLHDGSTDTTQRFHGATAFVARPPGGLGLGDPGNGGGLDAVFPAAATRAACITSFRQAPASALAGLPAAEQQAASFCLASSPLPDICFTDPTNAACEEALAAVATALGDANFPTEFTSQILPFCFQFGSLLENGASSGNCYPSGLTERSELEAFMLAFDSNLKPMVGQQVTLSDGRSDSADLRALLAAAAHGDCDAGVRQAALGYFVAAPNASNPAQSSLEDGLGRTLTLAALKRSNGPVTLTCYPPQPDHSEARRSALDRDADGVADLREIQAGTDPSDANSH
jgi:hypothetical protein